MFFKTKFFGEKWDSSNCLVIGKNSLLWGESFPEKMVPYSQFCMFHFDRADASLLSKNM